MFKATLLVDFDETITQRRGLDSPPNVDAVAALNKLKDDYKIVIFSCRGNRDIFGSTSYVELEEYLLKYNIPYDEISTRKPTFFMVIDDRSMNPKEVGWDCIVSKLLSKKN